MPSVKVRNPLTPQGRNIVAISDCLLEAANWLVNCRERGTLSFSAISYYINYFTQLCMYCIVVYFLNIPFFLLKF